jgi:hypothetical protein
VRDRSCAEGVRIRLGVDRDSHNDGIDVVVRVRTIVDFACFGGSDSLSGMCDATRLDSGSRVALADAGGR